MRKLILLITATIPITAHAAPCFQSPAAAIRQEGPISTEGYRVQTYRFDPELNRSWVVVQSCDHPERPSVVLEATSVLEAEGRTPAKLPAHDAKAQPTRMLVRAGNRVRLVLAEAQLRMELAGIAENAGTVGDRIRVRLLQQDTTAPTVYRTGIVRGLNDLEMEP